ncbi:hypothetical protein [Sphingomonas sp.]|uniref:hypothetical protein n=1 Tax=Sphingomonas sp. TaxID=28214 RepID=UPI002DD699FC|nr:hypothetical protein [Sphingomonas sp.]
MRRTTLLIYVAAGGCLVAGCGEPFASIHAPGRPCTAITAADHAAAIAAGAASGTASVSAGGTVSLSNGPGVVHCATFKSPLKPCRRPSDYVIDYTLADGSKAFVKVPANQQYRFRLAAAPTTCEFVD